MISNIKFIIYKNFYILLKFLIFWGYYIDFPTNMLIYHFLIGRQTLISNRIMPHYISLWKISWIKYFCLLKYDVHNLFDCHWYFYWNDINLIDRFRGNDIFKIFYIPSQEHNILLGLFSCTSRWRICFI